MVRRHLLRTLGAECTDALLRHLAADLAGAEEEEGGAAGAAARAASGGALSPGERTSIARQLAPDVRPAVSAALEKAGGADLPEFLSEFGAAAEAAGLRLRGADKRGERAAVFALRKALEAQAAAAADPAALLALAVPCLLARHAGRAVSLPGRALAAGVDRLRGDLGEEGHALLSSFADAVVAQLRGGGEAEVGAQLAELTPRVRALVAAPGGAAADAE